jgi:hypothetical protein
MDLVHDSYPSFFNVSSFNFQIFSFPSSRIYSVIINKLKSIKTFYVSNCLKGFFLVWTFDVIDCFKGLGLNVSDCFKGLRGWGRHGRCFYNYLCNQCLSKLWVQIPLMARCSWYNFMQYSLSVTCSRWWFSPGTSISSTNKMTTML